MRDPLKDPRALDVVGWSADREPSVATVLSVRDGIVAFSFARNGKCEREDLTLAEWSDWSGLDEVTVLHAEVVGRLVDVYAGAAGRAVVEERDALRAEAARLRATVSALQASQAATVATLAAQDSVRDAQREALRSEVAALRQAATVRADAVHAAVIEAIEAVHVAPPTWAGAVADDVLARLQAPTSKASAPQPDPLPAEGDVWAELIDGEPVAELRALYRERRALGIERYGVPLQRGNGRDHRADLLQELLDGMAYAQAANLPNVVAALRERVRDLTDGSLPPLWRLHEA